MIPFFHHVHPDYLSFIMCIRDNMRTGQSICHSVGVGVEGCEGLHSVMRYRLVIFE